MIEKIFLHLLIVCGIWSREIFGTLANEDINKLPNFLIRQKRIINPAEALLHPHLEVLMITGFVVAIEHDRNIECVGTILTSSVVITSAVCLHMHPSQYRVISHELYPGRGSVHNLTAIRICTGGHPGRPADGVGLVVVRPSFAFSIICRPMQLYSGPLITGTPGTISGWGHLNNFRGAVIGRYYPTDVRTIEELIVANQQCANRYRPHVNISKRDICTRPGGEVGLTNLGAGLVINNRLAGIFLRGNIVNGRIDPSYPTVFASLQDSFYRGWIIDNLKSIMGHYNPEF